MGCRLNRLDEPVGMAVSKPLLTEFGIHHRLESCGGHSMGHDCGATGSLKSGNKKIVKSHSLSHWYDVQ